jgi:hypothetical protein
MTIEEENTRKQIEELKREIVKLNLEIRVIDKADKYLDVLDANN